jgi:SAM-dependent methyltransferase
VAPRQDDSSDASQVDHKITRRFWQGRAAYCRTRADDPRLVTLSRTPSWLNRIEVSLYQAWLRRGLAALGGQWPRWRLGLDLGCGNGEWTVVLAEHTDRVLAVDFSPGFAAACRLRLDATKHGAAVSVVTADITEAELPRDCDVVMAGAVLQYLGDDDAKALLARIRAALGTQGVLYLRTTVSRSAASITKKLVDFQGIYRPKAWYDSALSAAGLTVVRSSIATAFVPEEVGHRWGRTVGAAFGAIWRRVKRLKKTDVVVYLATIRRRSVEATILALSLETPLTFELSIPLLFPIPL